MSNHEDIKEFNELRELSGSDYKMESGDPNISGWMVKDSLGRVTGIVKELLFNPKSRMVRYMVLNPQEIVAPNDVLIPIGFCELHEKEDLVILENVTREQIIELPPYTGVDVSPLIESDIRRILNGMTTETVDNAADVLFYQHDHFNTERLYSQRRKM